MRRLAKMNGLLSLAFAVATLAGVTVLVALVSEVFVQVRCNMLPSRSA